MRATDFLTESEFSPMTLKLSNYRGSYHPETMEPYSSEFQSAFDLVDLVEEMIEDGERPTVVNIDPKYMRANEFLIRRTHTHHLYYIPGVL